MTSFRFIYFWVVPDNKVTHELFFHYAEALPVASAASYGA